VYVFPLPDIKRLRLVRAVNLRSAGHLSLVGWRSCSTMQGDQQRCFTSSEYCDVLDADQGRAMISP